MVEPIRLRIAEIAYQSGYDYQKYAGPRHTGIKDRVDISTEAFERFRASRNQAPDGSGEEGGKKPGNPELKRNLEVLDLGLGAKPQEIRQAYLQAVKKYHPDKLPNCPPEQVKAAEERTKQINTAYSMLRKA